MNCDRAEELLAAYALSALAPEEAADLRAHLSGCSRHSAALAELGNAATLLALDAEERQPPAALRTRLLSAFAVERARPAAPVPRPGPWPRLLRPFPYRAAAAVLALAVLGLAAWNVVLQLDEGGGQSTVVREIAGETGRTRLVYLKEEGVAVLTLGLREAPSGRDYQAWHIEAGEAHSLGIVPNQGVAAFKADLGRATAVAISVEPKGGSPRPTSAPVLVLELGG